MFIVTTATKKILKLRKRIRAITGGASASKTISILMILIDYAQSTKGKIISVVSETLPHLKRGAMRDFTNIMKAQNYWKDNSWNATNFIYTFEDGSIIEFFSADQWDKVKGPRRDVLFVNEVNNIAMETFVQLEIRTREVIFIDWNPVAEFWWYTDYAPFYDHDFLTVTYKDNEALPREEVEAFEQHKNNPNKANWWKVYGEGQLGEATGRIFIGWQIIDDVPFESRLENDGLDFGYTNDPSALVDIYYCNGGYVLDEVFYQKGMTNKQIADVALSKPPTLILADSAEPKSIDEIKSYGVTIVGALKGPGSVSQGLQYIQGLQISVTKRSVNLIKEYRNYLWATDPKTGKSLNEPVGINDHLMSAIRYGFSRKFIDVEEDPAYNPPDPERLRELGVDTPYGGIEGYVGIPFGLQNREF
jgi:phage terminase large subunit